MIIYNKSIQGEIIMDSVIEAISTLNSNDLNEFEKNLMIGGGTPGPCLVKGKGIRVTDIDGKSYIDCTSQSWALYLGYANDEVTEAVCEHMSTNFSHIHQSFNTKQRFMLANELANIAPERLNRVSFTVGGGPAIEAAMKIALKNRPGAINFISLWDAYHGCTLASAGASWHTTKAAGNFTGQKHFLTNVNNNFIRVPNFNCYRCYFGQKCESCNLMCAQMLELTMQKGVNGPVAGVIIEPVQASGGQIPAPKKYLQKVREICDKFGALLIFDEIQTYCRIGEFFASTYYEVEPDIIVLGKGLGAGFPIAAIIIRDGLKGFDIQVEELHTFSNNTVSQVAALKLIEIIKRDDLLKNTRDVGNYIGYKLNELKENYPQIGDVRQVGLHIGVEMIEDDGSPLSDEKGIEIRSLALEKGLIIGTGGYAKNLLKIKPPLITTKSDADEILGIFTDVLKTIYG